MEFKKAIVEAMIKLLMENPDAKDTCECHSLLNFK